MERKAQHQYERRTQILAARVTPCEMEAIRVRAAAAGVTSVSPYVRSLCFPADVDKGAR